MLSPLWTIVIRTLQIRSVNIFGQVHLKQKRWDENPDPSHASGPQYLQHPILVTIYFLTPYFKINPCRKVIPLKYTVNLLLEIKENSYYPEIQYFKGALKNSYSSTSKQLAGSSSPQFSQREGCLLIKALRRDALKQQISSISLIQCPLRLPPN